MTLGAFTGVFTSTLHFSTAILRNSASPFSAAINNAVRKLNAGILRSVPANINSLPHHSSPSTNAKDNDV